MVREIAEDVSEDIGSLVDESNSGEQRYGFIVLYIYIFIDFTCLIEGSIQNYVFQVTKRNN